ncbi:MAG: hypothetical protein Q8K99_09370 [Actinomycetota bacterium]|nr:hypothetical protein [Actinomycetota bacterium]
MQVGSYIDGRELTYDQHSGQFAVGSTPVTLEQVREYDDFAQIEWSNDATRTWARDLQASKREGMSSAEPRRWRLLGFRSRRIWKMVIASVYYAFWVVFALAAVFSRTPHVADARDSAIEVVGGLVLAVLMISPALFLSDFGYRHRLPFFKHRKVLWSVGGFAVFFLLCFATIGLADSLHSPPYKAAVAAERVAEQKKREAERVAEQNKREEAAEAERVAEQEKQEARRTEVSQSVPAASLETTAERSARLAVEKKQAELAAVRGTDEYKALTTGGMNDEQARSFIKAAKIARISDIGAVTSREKSKKEGDIFLVNCGDGDIDVDYGVLFRDNNVFQIRDKELAVLYSKGKRNQKYIFWEEVGGPGRVKDITEAAVTAVLKSPSTAQFPGGWLDPLDGWGFKKTPGRIGITGYVDSQNSFGAMLRSQFKFIYKVSTGKDRGKLTPIYINFDGKVLLDER